MSLRTFKDHFSGHSDDYKRFRPIYPAALYQYLAETAPDTRVAWDVGCGNGQATEALAAYFQSVTGSDASAGQIAQTHTATNIRYVVSPAETLSADDHSIDLITVAQAIHWFDHPAFFAEVDRTLKPRGILATWGYQLLYTDTELDPVIEWFHSEVVGPYWPPERALLDNGYSKIEFPYPRLTPPDFIMRARWSFADLIGYLNTWSAVKQFEVKRHSNPVELHFEELEAAWGKLEEEKEIYWPLILYVGRKPV